MIASYLAVLGQRFFKAVLVSRKKKRINFEINGIKKQRIIMNTFSLDPAKFVSVSPLIRPVCGSQDQCPRPLSYDDIQETRPI